MMKKLLILFFIEILGVSVVYCNYVDTIIAKTVATNFYYARASQIKTQHIRRLALTPPELFLMHQEFDSVNNKIDNEPFYYVYGVKNNSGFIIVSADDDIFPVLAYSFDGKYDPSTPLPPAYIDWMNKYKYLIRYVRKNRNLQISSVKTLWTQSENNSLSNNNISETIVEPLLDKDTILWDQGCNYNIFCPYDENSKYECKRVPAGCVAVAMGQIMRYWKYPDHSNAIPGYLSPNYGQISGVNVTDYNWNQIKNTLTNTNADNEKEAVAQLLYNCGVSVKMDYRPEGSGAKYNDALISFSQYFNYSSMLQIIEKKNFSTEDWMDKIKYELNNDRPVYYRGDDGDNLAHAFVCDGYNSNNEFHFNWGWNGSCNGYYYHLSSLIPQKSYDEYLNANFTENQVAIIGILPNKPDLIPINPTTNIKTVQAGSSITVSCMEYNRSPANVDSHYISVYLSADSTLIPRENEDVFYLGEIYVPKALSGTFITPFPISVKIPSNIKSGQYFIMFYSDGRQEIDECFENNNITYIDITVIDQDDNNQSAKRVTCLEYFIDNDPGFGNGIPLNITLEKVFEGKFNIPLSNCSEGFHVFFVRAKDSDNKWSITQSAPFYKLKNTAQHVSYLEYFIDADPGFGLGTKLATNASGTISEYYNIPLASIKDGFHVLYIRAKDNNGIWSLCSSNSFYKIGTRSADIIKMEYFIDVDPGFNNAIPISITKDKSVQKVININLSEISNGFHTFFVRAQDASGGWSITHQSAFYKTSSKLRNITALESFFDMDPGYGYGTVIPVDNASPDVTKHINIELACLTSGQHTFYIRAKDEVGRWSLIHSKAIDIIITTPVITQSGDTLHSNASRGNQWYNQNGLIEGATDQVYIPTETGEYYIVVTQSNCSSEKSNIITVFYSGNKQLSSEQFVEIHPNPASESIHIKGISSYANISFFDISGKQVLNSVVISETVIHIDNLPRGWYIINIQTETGTKKIKLIKK